MVDDLGMSAWRRFLEAHAAVVERLSVELERETAMPLSWYDVLTQLEAAGGRLRMHELASAVLLSRSGMTRLVDRLEDAGLVQRCPDCEDRRGTVACLTTRGEDALHAAAPVHLRGIGEHFTQRLDDREKRVLATALRRIAEAATPPRRCASGGDPQPASGPLSSSSPRGV